MGREPRESEKNQIYNLVESMPKMSFRGDVSGKNKKHVKIKENLKGDLLCSSR